MVKSYILNTISCKCHLKPFYILIVVDRLIDIYKQVRKYLVVLQLLPFRR